MFRERLVEGADSGNTLQIIRSESGCCGDALTTCKYVVTVDPWVDFASITITKDGADVTIPFGATITDETELPAAIRTALASVGFISDDTPATGTKDVTVSLVATELTVEIWGEAVVVALTSSAAVAAAATANCVPYVDCLYTVSVAVGALTVSVDGGAPETLANSPYSTGQAASVATDIAASTYLAAATGITVTEDTDLDVFVITFRFERAEIAFNDTTAARTACVQNFTVSGD